MSAKNMILQSLDDRTESEYRTLIDTGQSDYGFNFSLSIHLL
jgi:hypothetical protein